jgi:hypothetical protein
MLFQSIRLMKGFAMNKSKDTFKDDVEYQDFLRELGARIHEVNEISKQHGIFLNDRELVSCTKCGLTEDIAFSGKLFTYYKDDPGFKETGFQFSSLDDNAAYLKCPVCDAEVLILKEKE